MNLENHQFGYTGRNSLLRFKSAYFENMSNLTQKEAIVPRMDITYRNNGYTRRHVNPGASTSFDPRYGSLSKTPIDVDRYSPTFAINSSEAISYMRYYAESGIHQSGDDEARKRALAFLQSKVLEKDEVTEEEKEWWLDFTSWMVARPLKKRDFSNTPWLKQFESEPIGDDGVPNGWNETHINLAMTRPDVAAFIEIFTALRRRFVSQIDNLKLTGPTNLNEAYLYFKYVVRNQYNEDFLADISLMPHFWAPDAEIDDGRLRYSYPYGISLDPLDGDMT
jgi:hypothetical protein